MRKFTTVLLLAALPVCLLTACSGRAVDNSQQQAQHDSVPLVSVKKQPLTSVISAERSKDFALRLIEKPSYLRVNSGKDLGTSADDFIANVFRNIVTRYIAY